ncbi:hypothetical protein NQ318_011938, partial [Aromia moschata]
LKLIPRKPKKKQQLGTNEKKPSIKVLLKAFIFWTTNRKFPNKYSKIRRSPDNNVPEPIDDWEGVLDATSNEKICYQEIIDINKLRIVYIIQVLMHHFQLCIAYMAEVSLV